MTKLEETGSGKSKMAASKLEIRISQHDLPLTRRRTVLAQV